jgi:hypothetical protein
MLGTLDDSDIEDLLKTERFGRIGCSSQDRAYVVPISYAYDGEAVYGHSIDGLKLKMMRENPEVCFQIDSVEAVNNWRSVIAWGRYEELTGPDAMRGLKLLMARFSSLLGLDPNAPPPPHGPRAVGHGHAAGMPADAFVYRIVLREKTGRFERV